MSPSDSARSHSCHPSPSALYSHRRNPWPTGPDPFPVPMPVITAPKMAPDSLPAPAWLWKLSPAQCSACVEVQPRCCGEVPPASHLLGMGPVELGQGSAVFPKGNLGQGKMGHESVVAGGQQWPA